MFSHLDYAAALALWPVALWILFSGLDDLFVLAAFLKHHYLSFRIPGHCGQPLPAEKPIAIFVPCWQEAAVIADMVEHNISAIRYEAYEIFIGAYPNDEATLSVARQLEARHNRVKLCLCPHDGPTSKADCLNWIYQQLLLLENENGRSYEVVLTHDAEDLIHPDELNCINRYTESYDMVQTPVLPLPTPWYELTHGLYCDDFAEGHTKDLVARQALGGFIPSCGVGTGYTRRALEKLAVAESNRVFEPGCLTEDYENGLRLHQHGLRQAFIPLRFDAGAPVATREYFPRTFWDAVKQRTRWVTGIALQSWERHGWSRDFRQAYWEWRDRKGLIGNVVSLAANALTILGLASWQTGGLGGSFFVETLQDLQPLLALNLSILLVTLAVRCACTAETYGWRFASGVPVRSLFGNVLNTVATFRAIVTYTMARLQGRPLVWVKTEHAYPSRAGLLSHKRPLEEILTGSHYLTPEQLALAHSTKPRGVRLTEHLVQSGLLSEDDLYEALSLQLGMALGRIEPHEVARNVARCLPVHLVREWNVLPVKIEAGSLHLASPEMPSDELRDALRRFTRLEIQLQLVTPTNFRRLSEALL